MLFSDKIKELRIESGKKQKDLAKAIGVDVPTYSRYEHGERRPKREQVLRLARIFRTDPDELVAAWLADEAYSHIAHDKMASRAAVLLRSMLNSPTNEDNETAKNNEDSQSSEPSVHRDMVAKLGPSAMPHYVTGDAATVMQQIEDKSIDCIVTTPPYWRRRSQGTESITAATLEDFIHELLETMAQAWRVLKPQGSLWLNVGDDATSGFFMGIPWRLLLPMINKQGWLIANEVVWNRVTTSPKGSQDHLRKVHEYMFHLVKGEDFYYDDDALRRTFALISRNEEKSRTKLPKASKYQSQIPSDVWTIGVQRSGIAHYRVAPDTLYRLPIVATCPHGGILLDPYCGTGTACKIAYEMNMRSIGIDINPDYIKHAKSTTEQKPLSLF